MTMHFGCKLMVVPGEWRVQQMGVTVVWMYATLSCMLALQDVVTGYVTGRHMFTVFLSPCSIMPCFGELLRKGAISRPRLFEALEVVWWCVLTALVHAEALFLEDSITKQKRMAVNAVLPVMAPALMGLRFSSYTIHLACCVVLNTVTIWYMVRFQGEPMSALAFPNSIISAFFGVAASLWLNGLFWRLYSSQSELDFEKSVLNSLTSLTCDATCWLADGQGTVSTSDRRVEDVFEVDMNGLSLADVVVEEEERERLARVLAVDVPQESGSAPVDLVSITIIKSTGRVRVELFIVRRNDRAYTADLERQLRDRAFFVGIRYAQVDSLLEKQHASQNEEVLGAVSDDSDSSVQAEEDESGTVEEDGNEHAESLRSIPRTTLTGRIFKSVDRQDRLAESLAQVKELVKQEKWSIPPTHMQMYSDDVLGSGGYGSVVRGKFHGAVVAVKLPNIKANIKGFKQLSNELRILRHARHPHLVQCFGAVIDDKSCSFGLVLEFIHGVSLNRFEFHSFANKAYAQRFKVIASVTYALSYLHSRVPVIVHGDLKPQNVLVEQRGARVHPKLLDFGLSRLLTSRVERTLGGTLRWRDFEIKHGCKPEASADIFSLGYLIYFTTTGKKPYADLSRGEIEECHRLRIVADLSWSVKSDFEVMAKDLAEKCLQKLKRRPNINQVSSSLSTVVDRDKSSDTHDCWRTFADMEFGEKASPDDNQAAQEPVGRRPCDPGGEHTSLDIQPSLCRLPVEDTKTESVTNLLKHWKLEIPPHYCCALHAGLHEMQAICSHMEYVPCAADDNIRGKCGPTYMKADLIPL
eukprot:TRINITY_DN3272_c0_g1_i1.p1 TRINITY_DN3272_c0_g1~~TRINITY_DN3272_c0_g1_i1.p1  ORF type:complete len:808 (-),score=101.71 TRINITY_DN3272_c0_g1_i1:87-2510(-)